jgi:hypothetical protein
MGYYILVSGEGTNKTETKVDEERSIFVALTDAGYMMEIFRATAVPPAAFTPLRKTNSSTC